MANSGWTADQTDITLPPDAGPADPRIYVGANDPFAAGLSQDAAIVFYWGEDRAFILSVENSGGAGERGQLHLWSLAPGNRLTQWLDLDHDVPTDNDTGVIGQALQELRLAAISTEIIPTSVAFGLPRQQCYLYLGDYSINQSPGVPVNDTIYYGRSAGRGQVNEAISTGVSASIGTTETTLLTFPSRTYYAGRAYEVTTKGGAQGAAANTLFQMRTRKTSTAGQDLGEFYRVPQPVAGLVSAASHGVGAGCKFRCTADVTATIVVTGQATATGNVVHYGSANTPREARISDIGESADYASYPVLV